MKHRSVGLTITPQPTTPPPTQPQPGQVRMVSPYGEQIIVPVWLFHFLGSRTVGWFEAVEVFT